VAGEILSSGVQPSRFCFIAHRFIPAVASAFSLAVPSSTRVRIDGLWGLPDGLEFCPHDSFEVDARSGVQLGRRIRYKPSFLAVSADGRWQAQHLGVPWDWRASIEEADLRSIAASSYRLARLIGRAVVIMWFVGVSPQSGHPALIPWRYTADDAPRQVESAVAWHFRRRPFFIRNKEDIESLQSATGPISSVVLQPDGPHLRKETFLRELADVVRARGLRIDLEGSPLSHGFYVLQRSGAHVACVDAIASRVIRRRFGKLVRDRIPVQIRRRGERAYVLTLPDDELVDVLKGKLVEEALEVMWANSAEMLQEEMADVFEVLRALSRAMRRSTAQLERDANNKRAKLGGFAKGVVLVETKDIPLLAVKGDTGLFEPIRTTVRTTVPNAVVAAGRRPKTQQDRIMVPLVPSVPSRLRGPTRVHVRSMGLTFRVQYREKFVEIVPEQENKFANEAQLQLPLEIQSSE
jgi:predicted house-cleaning noncanonical NTP pyrophosphatase (MazG superfamily)